MGEPVREISWAFYGGFWILFRDASCSLWKTLHQSLVTQTCVFCKMKKTSNITRTWCITHRKPLLSSVWHSTIFGCESSDRTLCLCISMWRKIETCCWCLLLKHPQRCLKDGVHLPHLRSLKRQITEVCSAIKKLPDNETETSNDICNTHVTLKFMDAHCHRFFFNFVCHTGIMTWPPWCCCLSCPLKLSSFIFMSLLLGTLQQEWSSGQVLTCGRTGPLEEGFN